MSLYVLKFGGSSVATTARIENVASIVKKLYFAGHRLVVVVSAMQGVTNHLVDLIRCFSEEGCNRECDVVISSGEQVSSGLLALSLEQNGVAARSFQGWQLPIITDQLFGEASIKSIKTDKLFHSVNSGVVPIVSGFQGVSKDGEITTIGRGGSDTSAVALARFLEADECFIYTDVDGVYTADPRIVLDARKLSHISYQEMSELSAKGAKVLQNRSVQMSQRQNVKLRVLSSFSSDGMGTFIQNNTKYLSKIGKITAISHNTSVFSICPNQRVLSFLKEKNIDFIKVNNGCIIIGKSHHGEIKKMESLIDSDVGIVSVVGQNVSDHECLILKKLSANHIDLKNKEVSSISLTIVVPFQQTEICVNILHNILF